MEGLLFDYLHFYGSYDYVGDSRRWYNKEVRIIRNDRRIASYKDAQGFRKQGRRIQAKQIDAAVYHYGWVKSPKQMLQKRKNTSALWSDQRENYAAIQAQQHFDYSDFDSLEKFIGTHPSVMRARVRENSVQVELDISRKKFSPREHLLYWFEKMTGIRPFGFRNYRII